jgi:hypothetical protein
MFKRMNCKHLIKNGEQCSREGKYLGCCSQHMKTKITKNTENVKLKSIDKATDGKHKFVATFEYSDGHEKHVSFGAFNMDDFTISKKSIDERKSMRERYRTRHMKDLHTHDPTAAGYLSMFILWGESTSMKENIKEYKRMFNL